VSLSVVTLTNTPGNAPTAAVATDFKLEAGKLGPIRVGQTVASLPKSVPGLYDSYKYTKEEIENEMDGSWTEERCHFYKGGKEIFQAYAVDKVLTSIVLMKGSEFIKTDEGFSVGCPARDVFSRKRMEWETWYTGTTFARNGHWEYHIPASGLVSGVDTPSKLTDIKPAAKIEMIIYYKE
jgi:hypothetical protein